MLGSLLSDLCSVSQIVQKLKLALEKSQRKDVVIEKLDAERKKLGTAYELASRQLTMEENKKALMARDLDFSLAEVQRWKADCLKVQGAAEFKAKRVAELEKELDAERKEKEAERKEKAALKEELEVERKSRAELEASTQAETDLAFRDGVAEATKDYEAQFKDLCPVLFELGCKEALKKFGVPEDHPIYGDLPRYEPEPNSASPDPTPLGPPPETPLPEIPQAPASTDLLASADVIAEVPSSANVAAAVPQGANVITEVPQGEAPPA